MSQNPFPISVQRTLEQVAAQMPVYMKGYLDLTSRNRVMRKIMDEYGMISYNDNLSYALTWNIADVLPAVSDFDDGPLSFNSSPALDRMTVIPRYKKTTARLGYLEWFENSWNDTQLVNLMQKRIEDCATAMANYFNQGFFDDGEATGAKNLHGIESFFGVQGSGDTAADRFLRPDDSYGGQDTDLGAAGGSWGSGTNEYNATLSSSSISWPIGAGDPRYDRCSPLLVNITSTGWGSGTASWRANCEQIMRLTQQVQIDRTGKSRKGGMRLHLLSLQLLNDLMEHLSDRNYVVEPLAESTEYGIPEVFNFEGCGFATDTDVPAQTGYFLDTGMIEFRCGKGELVSPVAEDYKNALMYSHTENAYIGAWWMPGNFRHQPKFHAKYYGWY